jgi:hypothetical protein
MDGLIGKMEVLRGQRDALIAIVLEGQRFETKPVGGHGLPA